jgi:hypothetical protein
MAAILGNPPDYPGGRGFGGSVKSNRLTKSEASKKKAKRRAARKARKNNR